MKKCFYIIIIILLFIINCYIISNKNNLNVVNILNENKIELFINNIDNVLLNVYERDISNINLNEENKIFIVKAYILQNKSKFLNKIKLDIENKEYMVYNDFIDIYNLFFESINIKFDNIYLDNIDFLKVYFDFFKINYVDNIDNNIYKVSTSYYYKNNLMFNVDYYLKYDNSFYLVKYDILR